MAVRIPRAERDACICRAHLLPLALPASRCRMQCLLLQAALLSLEFRVGSDSPASALSCCLVEISSRTS